MNEKERLWFIMSFCKNLDMQEARQKCFPIPMYQDNKGTLSQASPEQESGLKPVVRASDSLDGLSGFVVSTCHPPPPTHMGIGQWYPQDRIASSRNPPATPSSRSSAEGKVSTASTIGGASSEFGGAGSGETWVFTQH